MATEVLKINMEHKSKEKKLPSQGGRIPSGRRVDSPAINTSSSSEGKSDKNDDNKEKTKEKKGGQIVLEDVDSVKLAPQWLQPVSGCESGERLKPLAEGSPSGAGDANVAETVIPAISEIPPPGLEVEASEDADVRSPGAATVGACNREDVMVIVDSDEEEEEEFQPPSGRRYKKRKAGESPDVSPSIDRRETTGSFLEIFSAADAETKMVLVPTDKMRGMTTNNLMDLATDCLEKMENIRLKSKRLQGKLSGSLKCGLTNVRGTLEIFNERLSSTGDTDTAKIQVAELTSRLRSQRRDAEVMKENMEKLTAENERLRRELEAAREPVRRESFSPLSRSRGRGTAPVGEPDGGRSPLGGEDFPPLPQRKKPRIISDVILAKEDVYTSESGTDSRAGRIMLAKRPSRNPLPTSSAAGHSTRPGARDVASQELKKIQDYINILADRRREIRSELTETGENSEDPASDAGRRPSSNVGKSRTQPRRTRAPIATPRGPPPAVTDRAFKGMSRRRPPRTAAVTITSIDPKVTYADLLKKARENIQLENLGIESSRIRRGVNGGLVIEIPGEDGVAKANELTARLREVLGSTAARINRPTAMGELRIWGFDDSIEGSEIANAISVMGDCDEFEVRLGNIRAMRSGLNSVWAKCPLAAAIKASASGKLRIGWTISRVELLDARPVQCFKCWRFGHVRNTCNYPEDRTGSCFRCGSREHRIDACNNNPHCAVCSHDGRPADHRVGSNASCYERSGGGRRSNPSENKRQ